MCQNGMSSTDTGLWLENESARHAKMQTCQHIWKNWTTISQNWTMSTCANLQFEHLSKLQTCERRRRRAQVCNSNIWTQTTGLWIGLHVWQNWMTTTGTTLKFEHLHTNYNNANLATHRPQLIRMSLEKKMKSVNRFYINSHAYALRRLSVGRLEHLTKLDVVDGHGSVIQTFAHKAQISNPAWTSDKTGQCPQSQVCSSTLPGHLTKLHNADGHKSVIQTSTTSLRIGLNIWRNWTTSAGARL